LAFLSHEGLYTDHLVITTCVRAIKCVEKRGKNGVRRDRRCRDGEITAIEERSLGRDGRGEEDRRGGEKK
jgi:hypothetical protein